MCRSGSDTGNGWPNGYRVYIGIARHWPSEDTTMLGTQQVNDIILVLVYIVRQIIRDASCHITDTVYRLWCQLTCCILGEGIQLQVVETRRFVLAWIPTIRVSVTIIIQRCWRIQRERILCIYNAILVTIVIRMINPELKSTTGLVTGIINKSCNHKVSGF